MCSPSQITVSPPDTASLSFGTPWNAFGAETMDQWVMTHTVQVKSALSIEAMAIQDGGQIDVLYDMSVISPRPSRCDAEQNPRSEKKRKSAVDEAWTVPVP